MIVITYMNIITNNRKNIQSNTEYNESVIYTHQGKAYNIQLGQSDWTTATAKFVEYMTSHRLATLYNQ